MNAGSPEQKEERRLNRNCNYRRKGEEEPQGSSGERERGGWLSSERLAESEPRAEERRTAE